MTFWVILQGQVIFLRGTPWQWSLLNLWFEWWEIIGFPLEVFAHKKIKTLTTRVIEAVLLDEEGLNSQLFIQNPSLMFLDTEQTGQLWDSDSAPKVFTN